MKPAMLIHAFSAVAAGVGAGMAPAPGSDATVLVGLQTAMVVALAEKRGVTMSSATAAELVLTLSATMAGTSISRLVLSRLPGVGVAVNAVTAAAVTEAVGWSADAWFRNQMRRDPAAQGSA